ncbi:MAG: tetratricopeptide repeat protein, partial [Bacteroidota bacterium]|nr:tetratricopeptide repeat protein [Bacteroidota bacterium]
LLAVSSVAPDNQPVTRLDLSLLLNALDYHLIRKDGLLSFFHDYLRNAVEKRYLGDKDKQKALHSKLAKYFATLPVGKRRIDEEPWQWQNAEDWENFNGSLTNIPLLEKLLDEDRLYELIGYWVKLHDHFDPASHYRTAIERFEKECDDENRLATLYGKLGNAFTVSAAYDAAEHFLRLALELRRKHPHEKLPIAEILHKLGILHYERRENNKAEICFREALTLLADEKDSESRDFSLMVEKDLGAVMIALRKYDEAELIYTKVLDQVQRKSKSKRTPEIANILNSLGAIAIEKKDYDSAESFMKHSYEIYLHIYGKFSPDVATVESNLGRIYRGQKQYDSSEKHFLTAIDIYSSLFGPQHPILATVYTNLAVLMRELRRFNEAMDSYSRALEIRKSSNGEDHISTIMAYTNVAGLHLEMGDYPSAKLLYDIYLPKKEQILSSDHPSVLKSKENYRKLLKLME